MEKFFSGRDVKLLTDEKETPGVSVWKLNLEMAEIGHMSCRMEDGVTFLYADQEKMLCQVNQERIELCAGEGMFVNSRNAYRFVQGQDGGCSFYAICIDAEYLQRDPGICGKYVQPLLLEEQLPYIKLINTGFSDEKLPGSPEKKTKQSEKKPPGMVLGGEQGKQRLDQ